MSNTTTHERCPVCTGDLTVVWNVQSSNRIHPRTVHATKCENGCEPQHQLVLENYLQRVSHAVLFYNSYDEVLTSLSTYVREGLADGDTCIVIATDQHLRRLRSLIGPEVLDSASGPGSYIALDADITRRQVIADGKVDPALFDQVIGQLVRECIRQGERVRVYGEMVALLWADGDVKSAIELEELWNALIEAENMELFCSYPDDAIRHVGVGDAEIIDRHTHVVDITGGASRSSAVSSRS